MDNARSSDGNRKSLDYQSTQSIAEPGKSWSDHLDRWDQILPFKYSPLQGQQGIRLLHIIPGEKDYILHCKCIPYSSFASPTTPKYTAISYTWGDSAQKEAILLNEGKHYITRNAKEVLLSVRDPLDSRIVWIDAICINQSDITERDTQVRIMRQIYGNAEQTLVWLGKASEDSSLAIDFIPLVNKALGELGGPETISDDTSLLAKLQTSRDSPGWEALGSLLARPWFHRVWVVQEVALSRTVHVMCGDKRLGWDEFGSMIGGLYERRLIHLIKNKPKPNILTTGASTLWSMHDMRRRLTDACAHSLSFVFFSTMGFLATDAKDKVFAILGLIQQGHADALDVNYQNTIAEVYLKATQISLSTEDGFYIICLAGLTHSSNIPHLPSWVPDFSRDLPINPFGIPSSLHETVHYSAGISCGVDIAAFAEVTGRCLKVKGQFMDTISDFGLVRVASNQEKCEGVHHFWYDWVQEAIKLVQKHEQTGCAPDASKTIWRAIIANATLHAKEPAPSSYCTYFETFKRLYLSGDHLQGSDWRNIHPRIMNDASISKDDKAQAYEYFFALLDANIGRRFCVTMNGRIGLVPAGVQKGDNVCVICGARVPFIDRPVAETSNGKLDYFHLVGDCYIDGLMAGEAFLTGRFQEIAFL